MNCIFCKIIDEQIPANKIYDDEQILVFHDINPVAPFHILIIPKKHISSLAELQANDQELMGYMLTKASELAKQLGISDSGYRTVINTNAHGGQVVEHLHMHVIGGTQCGTMI